MHAVDVLERLVQRAKEDVRPDWTFARPNLDFLNRIGQPHAQRGFDFVGSIQHPGRGRLDQRVELHVAEFDQRQPVAPALCRGAIIQRHRAGIAQAVIDEVIGQLLELFAKRSLVLGAELAVAPKHQLGGLRQVGVLQTGHRDQRLGQHLLKARIEHHPKGCPAAL